MSIGPILCLIPARGGSKGLPGKNIRPLAGFPLIAHSILCGKSLLGSAVDRLMVSTDSPEIAEIAKRYGADVPFLRPASLAADDTPMLPVLQHAILEMEKIAANASAHFFCWILQVPRAIRVIFWGRSRSSSRFRRRMESWVSLSHLLIPSGTAWWRRTAIWSR